MIVVLLCCLALMLVFLIFKRKASIARYEAQPLIHLLDTGVLILSSTYQGLECNRLFCKILGCQSSDLLMKDFFSLGTEVNAEVVSQCQSLLQTLNATEIEQRGSICYNQGSESCSLEIRAARLTDQEYVLILKDTSDDYQTFKMGKDFIANASHELRTPITIIKGFIETLQDLPEVSDAMLEDIFEKVLRSCNRMEDIVKNLLLLTDLDHCGKTHIQSVDLVALLDNCRHSLLEMYPDVVVEMMCTKQEKRTEVNPSLLELAIMNLLQNAVKYSIAPAQIAIKLREEAGECFISIMDRGCGIPKENRPHIFNRFYSVNKTVSRRLGGAGLGLSIVKNIVEKHQGSITVEDHPLGGTIFTLALPNS
jgi:two-component system, OmpR family, phosphate regulon sensor histidine kinase PhoR